MFIYIYTHIYLGIYTHIYMSHTPIVLAFLKISISQIFNSQCTVSIVVQCNRKSKKINPKKKKKVYILTIIQDICCEEVYTGSVSQKKKKNSLHGLCFLTHFLSLIGELNGRSDKRFLGYYFYIELTIVLVFRFKLFIFF